METEIWKSVVGSENRYEVSNFGNVKSLRYRGNNDVKILKPYISKQGYRTVAIYKDGKQRTTKIAVLVAMAFLGHLPNYFNKVVDHIDNNQLNDNLLNLQVISNRENTSKDKNPNSKNNNIYKSKNQYEVAFWIKGKTERFGRFNNIKDAIIKRNEVLSIFKKSGT